MATIEKYSDKAARDLIGHVERSLNFDHMSNREIDFSKTKRNYAVGIQRENPFGHYKTLLDRCYVYGRNDVKTLVGVVFPLPHDTPPEEEQAFFEACFDFLKENFFPEQAIISAQVHVDETRPHLHVLAVPIVANKDKTGKFRYKEPPSCGEPDTRRTAEKFKLKISATDVLTRNSYFRFHGDLQRYLKDHGITGTVQSGVTKAQGGAMSVRELKRETALERAEREARIEQNLKLQREQERGRFSSFQDIEIERRRF